MGLQEAVGGVNGGPLARAAMAIIQARQYAIRSVIFDVGMLPARGVVTLVDGILTERDGAMKSLPERIMGYAEAKPEATPIQAEDLTN